MGHTRIFRCRSRAVSVFARRQRDRRNSEYAGLLAIRRRGERADTDRLSDDVSGGRAECRNERKRLGRYRVADGEAA